MDVASDLLGLQSAEDFERYIQNLQIPLSAWSPKLKNVQKLRLGQELLRKWLSSLSLQSDQCFVQFPTGYGKTWAALIAFLVLRSRQKATHMLVVCPTDEQRSMWLDDTDRELETMGEEPLGVYDAGEPRAVTALRRGEAGVFVTTTQSLIHRTARDVVTELTAVGKWLVVIDEAHYYPDNDKQAWVDAIMYVLGRPNVQFKLPMTATPVRSDRKLTLFGRPDICIPPKVAVEEGAIRAVKSIIGDYDLDISVEEQKTPIRINTAYIAEDMKRLGVKSVREWELRRKVRYHDKYVSRLLYEAIHQYLAKNRKYVGRHQIIIFAMTVAHAKHVATAMNKLGSAMCEDADRFADYIGDTAKELSNGVDNPAYRSQRDNERILRAFKDRKLPCLVQVAKAGVGFNHKHCSIIVFLNDIGDTVLIRQMAGRGFRRDYEIDKEDDICHLIVGSDHPAAEFIRELDDITDGDEGGGCGGGGGGGDQLFLFPSWSIIDVHDRGNRIYTPYGDFEDTQSAVVAAMERVRDLKETREHSVSDEQLERVIRRLLMGEHTVASAMGEREKLRQAKANVEAAISSIVGNVMKLRSKAGRTFSTSTAGDLKMAIHQNWKMHSGMSHREMTVSDFLGKYEWLKEIDASLREGGETAIPRWLDL